MRFSAKYEFMDFLRDHENNIYIYNNLLKKKEGLLILFFTIFCMSNILPYLWIMGGIYFFGYFIHFTFIYQKQQPYTIDIQNFVERTNPTVLDCIKIVQKIAKSAAFTKFYKLLEFYYAKKKSNIKITKILQTIIISLFLGYNYWCLCVILDIALTIYILSQKKNFYIRLKIFIVYELSQKYGLSSYNPKELRIYWFNSGWVFNPKYVKTPIKLWDVQHYHPGKFYVKHIGIAPEDPESTLLPTFFLTKKISNNAEWLSIKNTNPNINKQFIVINQLVKSNNLADATNYSKILKNCGLDNEFNRKLLYKIAKIHSLKSTHTVLNLGDHEELIQKNINLIIIDNDLSGHTFSDNMRWQHEQLLVEKNNNIEFYKFCQNLDTEPLDIKNLTIKQHNIEQLLNFPMERYDFDSHDQQP